MTAAAFGALAQQAVVGVVVMACAAYAAWSLAPAALRRPLARWLLRRRWLAGSTTLRAAARVSAAGACGCDGCDAGKAPGGARTPAASAGQVVRIVPRSQMPR